MNISSNCLESRDFQRVAKALAYIERHWRDQPRLAEIASHVGLSLFHFNRMFHRWAGITPKAYLQFVTGAVAKAGLQQRLPLLDTALAVGLSGPGRLHDLIVNIEAMSPAQFARGGAGIAIDWGLAPSPFGLLLAARTGRGICHLGFVDSPDRQIAAAALLHLWPEASLRWQPETAVTIVNQLWPVDGARDAKPQPLLLQVRGTNFQIKVWQALLALRPGASTSYGALARQLGSPGAARAIGSAVGANPVAWLIPCHRVLRGGGELGGYHWGVDRKRAMLAWERLHGAAARRANYSEPLLPGIPIAGGGSSRV